MAAGRSGGSRKIGGLPEAYARGGRNLTGWLGIHTCETCNTVSSCWRDEVGERTATLQAPIFRVSTQSNNQQVYILLAGQENDMSDNDNSTSGFGWFLAGLGVGALVGVLYAPKSGAETRDDIAASALEARDKATALAQQGKERAADLANQAQIRANELAAQGKQQVGEYVDRGKEYYDKGRSQFNEYVEKGKDLVQEQQDKVAAAIEAGKGAYVSTTSDTQS